MKCAPSQVEFDSGFALVFTGKVIHIGIQSPETEAADSIIKKFEMRKLVLIDIGRFKTFHFRDAPLAFNAFQC